MCNSCCGIETVVDILFLIIILDDMCKVRPKGLTLLFQ